MKGFTLISVIVAFCIAASTATAAPQARDPRVPALQRQVATLTSHVQHDELALSCFIATQLNLDIGFLNIFNAMFGQPTDPTHISDNGACAAIGLNPPRRSFSATRSPFDSLTFMLSRVVGQYR